MVVVWGKYSKNLWWSSWYDAHAPAKRSASGIISYVFAHLQWKQLFFYQIVTMDETCVPYYEPEYNQNYIQCIRIHSKKALSAQKHSRGDTVDRKTHGDALLGPKGYET